MEELKGLYTESVERFLKTVVCFDDEAYQFPQKHREPVSARRIDDGFDKDDITTVEEGIGNIITADDKPTDNAHWLNAKELTDAFAEKGILCSVVNPGNKPEEMQKCIARMARTADVVILDWEMPGRDNSVAQNAIAQVLEADRTDGGCLRLIVIYSAADGRTVIDDLERSLAKYKLKKMESGLELRNEHALIVFLNKPDVFQGSSTRVDYKELPERIIKEMLKLTEGLLPSTVLRAVSLLRERSHHLLAKFPANLDGAYIVHRALIPDPSDAEAFLLDLLTSELSFMLYSVELRKMLNGISCSQWLDINQSLTPQEQLDIKIAVTTVLEDPKKNKAKDIVNRNNLFGKKNQKEIANQVFTKIYGGIGVEEAKADTAILTTLDRKSWVRSFDVNPPRLKLGSIVKLENEYLEDEYFLCFQPLCDSIRISIDKDTLFPFLKLCARRAEDKACQHEKKETLDICIRDKNQHAVWLGVETMPRHIISYPFKAISKENAYIAAELKDGAYFFCTTDNRLLEWCADLKIGKAQRLASELASRIHTLGIDEFEWMRLHQ